MDLGNGVNPVVLPVAADPSVVRAPDGSYYLYATSDDWQDGGGMHYMPIFHSTDLVNWSHVGDVLQGQPGWTDAGGGPWAPDVHLVNGKY
ncbi:MAG: family 43 glycosylhydrolase, partial [Tomitella sp.]|nr:family 43 glycosylhydrolase [Tomitella sp.]